MVGGDRMVFWKAKSEEVDDEIYGPVWIANLEGEIIEDTGLWLSFEEAEEFARRRELPLEEVCEELPVAEEVGVDGQGVSSVGGRPNRKPP